MPHFPAHIASKFVCVERGQARGLVLRQGSEQITGALFAPEKCEVLPTVGRGAMRTFPWLPGRRGILRRYRRGGVIRHLLRESYLLRNRPLCEFLMHTKLIELGLPVPNLLGVCWTRRGCLYSGFLATEELLGIDLDGWLRLHREDPEGYRSILNACGKLIKEMHEAGIIHGDLQVKNIFICAQSPFIMDLDGARLHPAMHGFRCQCNLLRFRRSFEKRGHGRVLFDILLEGYGPIIIYKWLDLFYSSRGRLSDLVFFWRSTKK